MHPNPIFRESQTDRNAQVLAQTGFGVLTMNGDDVPLIAHVPFVYDPDAQLILFHLVRSNPIARVLRNGPRTAKFVVNGPHGYISPDWYGIDDQVPTWNYVAVHATGMVTLLPDADLGPILTRLSDHFEGALAPKPIWKMSKLDPATQEKMMRQIVPCQMTVDELDGTWKLGQNKPDAARVSAADALGRSSIGVDTAHLSRLMQDVE